MAKNNHDWSGPTPFTHSGSIDKSGMSHWDTPTDNAVRDFTGPTPHTHSGKVGKSGGDGIGKPNATAGDREEMPPIKHGNGPAPAIMASGPKPKSGEAKSWKKKNYATSVPTTLGGGHMRKGRRDISG